MILLIDADSLIFASCYRTRDEENDDPYYRDIEDSIVKFDEQFMKIVNDLEEQYEIDKVITFNGSKGNSKFVYGLETDDLVAKYWQTLSKEFGRDNVMIVSIDKDYKQFPCLMYNYHYKHQVVLDISEEEALYNFYEQMIVGDTADNVNYFKGKGKKFAENYFRDCKSKYQYTANVIIY